MRGGRGAGGAAPSIPPEVGARSGAPAADPFGLDLVFREKVRPAFQFLHDSYWRVEVRGAKHVPATGPALLVANHSGALPFDGAMICAAVELRAGRTARFLFDRFVESLGPVATFYRKLGGAVASRENALALLAAGELVLLFPEGVSGVAKSFNDRYRLQTFSPGCARLALTLDVPIIPVAVVGAEEIYPLVGRIENLGRLLGAPYVPVTPFFPLLGLLGALPLPTKWYIRFGKPIWIKATDGESRFQRAGKEAEDLKRKIQTMVNGLRRARRSVFFG